MTKKVGIVLLAAGKGTRLKLKTSKPLASLLSKKLIDFPLDAGFSFIKQSGLEGEITVVTGYERESLESYLTSRYKDNGENLSFVLQDKQLGTAHALQMYFEQNKNAENNDFTMVLCADTPLISSDQLLKLLEDFSQKNLDGVCATFKLDNPFGYGRIVRHKKGFSITEQKDACEEVLKINEVNSGLYLLKTEFVLKHLNNIDSNNKSGEFYLTDLFKEDYNVEATCFDDAKAFFGVNDLNQLENMETEIQKRKINELSNNGVRFLNRENVYLHEDVEVGSGTIIYPNVVIEHGSIIGEDCIIESGSVIKQSEIANSVIIKANSYLDNARVKNGVSIGPFAHLRPGSEIGEEAKIGNFVEIKKSRLDKGVKVSHLSYVGDAEIGENTNIGCGFITCNYDGANKHLTKIGKDCFIGSDSQMIAPVEIGDKCYVASGSTINQSLKDGDFAIARTRQTTKEGLARKFLKKKS